MLGVDGSDMTTGKNVTVDEDTVDDGETDADTDAETAILGDGDGDACPPEGQDMANGAVSRRNSMRRSHVAC